MIATWRSILALVVFFLTNLVGVFPFSIPLPLSTPAADAVAAKLAVFLRICLPSESCCKEHPGLFRRTSHEADPRPPVYWRKITIGFQTAPLAAVLLLLATGVLHGKEIREGITGTSGIEPLDIMALFISLAYLAISLDTTGLFRFLAFWVVRKGGSSGRRLYLYLYAFFFAAGILVGNDPVVLFGTPFLAYFSRASGIVPPTAWVFAQFVVANTAAAVLPSANLTNLVLTGAFSFSFISYAAHAILPTLAAGIAVYPLLAFVLFKSPEFVPRQIDVVDIQHPQSETRTLSSSQAPDALTDKKGAIFGSVLLSITLIVLVGTSPLKVPVWMVTVPPALIMLLRDVWHDRSLWTSQSSNPVPDAEQADGIAMQETGARKCCDADVAGCFPDVSLGLEEKSPRTLGSLYHKISKRTLPTLFNILPRLPISLVLFAFCMFILVQALTTWGWVEVFAGWWTAWIRVCEQVGNGFATVGAIYMMLIASTLLCNICGTNIGTTILLARVLQSWLSSTPSVDPKVKLGSIYALALGSNFGAYTFSFSASLAGLLWRDILRQKGIAVSQRHFAMYNVPTIAVSVVTAGAVLIAEVYIVAK
ncbi:hypothetical protein BDW22DRAFT_1363465 [Trametopsis cervina]|nr:hypothetical protein BDW22DRAFT_1363465 [Trametopsis cervina]